MLTVNESVISNNDSGGGGGISNIGGAVAIASSIISRNDAVRSSSPVAISAGGGILSVGGTVTITNSTVSKNGGTEIEGGGVFNTGTMRVMNSTISDNTNEGIGCGISNAGTMTITNTIILANRCFGFLGGGIINRFRGTMTIINSTIFGQPSGSWRSRRRHFQ